MGLHPLFCMVCSVQSDWRESHHHSGVCVRARVCVCLCVRVFLGVYFLLVVRRLRGCIPSLACHAPCSHTDDNRIALVFFFGGGSSSAEI